MTPVVANNMPKPEFMILKSITTVEAHISPIARTYKVISYLSIGGLFFTIPTL